ncbi:methyl-accepting chemotaxis protein [Oribacterium sp. P6A1]|uniref:methyl-accepting chemotaxis protein n=1 Tax=Oribacterium sp. P6A1 TaxID=1410612 RepID=UPI00068EED0E|nr:methyl-accepting chemotaxis protein [Oribacterium sp. P6A1]
MKINEFCNLTELSSIIKSWSDLTGSDVMIKGTDGETIVSTSSEDPGAGQGTAADDELGEFDSTDSSSRGINFDIILNDSVIGTATVTESSSGAALNTALAVKLLEELINNFIQSQYFNYANGNVLSNLSDGLSQTVKLVKEVITSTNNLKDIQKRQKIVAINASIEAARVGQAGRGFAVVAEEVKKLSDASSDATGKIERVVNKIQSIVSSLSISKNEEV